MWDKLIDAVPKLKTKVQLAGFVVLVAAVLIVQVISPNNIRAILAAGSVGVSLVIFGQLFQYLHLFRPRDRALLVIVLFLIFCGFTATMVVLVASLIVKPKVDVTLFDEPLPTGGERDADYEKVVRQFDSENSYRTLTYNFSRRGTQSIISYSMPYISDYLAGKPLAETQPSWFDWHLPILAVNLTNPSTNDTLQLDELQLRVTEVIRNINPLVMFWSPMKEQGDHYILNIENLLSGSVQHPKIRYRLAVGANSSKELGILRSKNLTSFSQESKIDVSDAVKGAPLTDPEARLVGDLAYETEAGAHTVVRFSLRLNAMVNGGFFQPSHLYNVSLDPSRTHYTVYKAISQLIRPGDGESFLVAIYSPVAARYTLTAVLKSTSGTEMESNSVVVDVAQPNPWAADDMLPPDGLKRDVVPTVQSVGGR